MLPLCLLALVAQSEVEPASRVIHSACAVEPQLVLVRLDAKLPRERIARVDFERRIASHVEPPRSGDELRIDGRLAAQWRTPTIDANGSSIDDAVCGWTNFRSDVACVRVARLSGAETLWIGDVPYGGDELAQNLDGVPIALERGSNSIYVFGARGSFSLEFAESTSRAAIGLRALTKPEMAVGKSIQFHDWVKFAVLNVSTRAISRLHVHYADLDDDGRALAPPRDANGFIATTQWDDSNRLGPLELISVSVPVGGGIPDSPGELPYVVTCSADDDLAIDYEEIPIRVLERGQTARGSVGRSAPIGSRWRNTVDLRRAWSVVGTAGNESETRELRELARFDAERCWIERGFAPWISTDAELLELLKAGDPLWRERPIVLYGNQETNRAWSKCLDGALLPRVARHEIITERGRYVGEDLAIEFAQRDSRSGAWLVARGDSGSAGRRVAAARDAFGADAETGNGAGPRVASSIWLTDGVELEQPPRD